MAMPTGHILPHMKETPAAELQRLRAEKSKVEWAALLQVPYRTYLRYELGQRDVPPVVMLAARQAVQLARKRKTAAKKRGI